MITTKITKLEEGNEGAVNQRHKKLQKNEIREHMEPQLETYELKTRKYVEPRAGISELGKWEPLKPEANYGGHVELQPVEHLDLRLEKMELGNKGPVNHRHWRL